MGSIATQAVKAQDGCSNKANSNGPFPSSKTSHFQNEAVQNFSCENEFYLHENKRPFLYQ